MPHHVLVVEDDKMHARLFEVILKRRGGFEVTVTDDAGRALEVARQGKINLVIMDVSLTGTVLDGKSVDGLGITRLLKEDPLTAGIPVILVTAHAVQGDREKFLAASRADDYIPKPILHQTHLVDVVSRHLKTRAATE